LSEIARYGLVFLVVFLANFQSSITGFGGTVLALPFVTLLIGLRMAVPVLVIEAWVLALLIVIEARRHISWPAFGRLLGFVAIGLPFGIWMSSAVPDKPLKLLLGLFTLVVGLYGLVRPALPTEGGLAGWRGIAITALLPLGGVIHGAFGSGGPLMVVYCARALSDKSLFRVTMSLLWLALNTVLISQWAVAGTLTVDVLEVAGMCAPFMLAGLALGGPVHYRVDERLFRRVVHAMLAVAAVALLGSVAR